MLATSMKTGITSERCSEPSLLCCIVPQLANDRTIRSYSASKKYSLSKTLMRLRFCGPCGYREPLPATPVLAPGKAGTSYLDVLRIPLAGACKRVQPSSPGEVKRLRTRSFTAPPHHSCTKCHCDPLV